MGKVKEGFTVEAKLGLISPLYHLNSEARQRLERVSKILSIRARVAMGVGKSGTRKGGSVVSGLSQTRQAR